MPVRRWYARLQPSLNIPERLNCVKKRLRTLADQLRSSYWFLPAMMAALAIPLSMLAVHLDVLFEDNLKWVMGLVYVDSPEAARTVLSTIASSMITVAGVVFSLTMVVLSLTSQQYGSLVLDNFMRDRVNQSVLGVFTATFIYCLLVLRTIRGTDESVFIPHIAVLLGLGLSITSFAVLIYYIHHVSESIQASSIITRISRRLHHAIDSLFPAMIGHGDGDASDEKEEYRLAARSRQPIYVQSQEQGYMQYIDDSALMHFAKNCDTVIELKERPGQFIVEGEVLAIVWAVDHRLNGVEDEINQAVILGKQRTPGQDVEFLLTQLASIAVRALSPGINDPYTAVQCVNRLEGAFCKLVNREFPSEYRYDESDRLRVVAHPTTFAKFLNVAFDEIGHYGRDDAMVMETVLRTLQSVRNCAHSHDRKAQVQSYIERLPKIGEDVEHALS
jgi:uncharacterized membrane protein